MSVTRPLSARLVLLAAAGALALSLVWAVIAAEHRDVDTRPAAKRSGATESSLCSPRTARATAERFSSAPRCALTSATEPGAARSSPSAWSCMSETSGETTTVRSSRISAGSW